MFHRSSAEWAEDLTTSKASFQGFPAGFLDLSQNVGMSFKLKQNKQNLQARKGCPPVLGCLAYLPMARGGQAGTTLGAYLPAPSPAGLMAAEGFTLCHLLFPFQIGDLC